MKGKNCELDIVCDPEDIALIEGKFSYCDNKKFVYINVKGRQISLHRFIWNNYYDKREKNVVTINKNNLDVRKSNLKSVSSSYVRYRSNIGRNNTSGYKNVSWVRRDGCWFSYFRFNGIVFRIGSFKDIHKAAYSVNIVAYWLVGEQYKMNDIFVKFETKEELDEFHDECFQKAKAILLKRKIAPFKMFDEFAKRIPYSCYNIGLDE